MEAKTDKIYATSFLMIKPGLNQQANGLAKLTWTASLCVLAGYRLNSGNTLQHPTHLTA